MKSRIDEELEAIDLGVLIGTGGGGFGDHYILLFLKKG